MGGAEVRVLLDAVGVRLRDTDHGQLIERTEGWPVGLYLAALAIKAGGPEETAGLRFSGDDRPMADYLGSELLSRLSEDEVSFLTRTSVLERRCGPLCDAVLGANDSGEVLRSLEGSNLLLVALDQRAEWYRYHHLLRDLLGAELRRREPDIVPRLHLGAATWYEANGLPELAIDHAKAAGDPDRVARLVVMNPVWATGRVDTVLGWMERFEHRNLIERYPAVAVHGALIFALLGRPGPNAGRRRPNGRPPRAGCPMAAPWRASWPTCARCCAATASPRCGVTQRSPWMGSAQRSRTEWPWCTPRASPTCWRVIWIGPTRSLPAPSMLRSRSVRCRSPRGPGRAVHRRGWLWRPACGGGPGRVGAVDGAGREFDAYWTSALVYAWAARAAIHRGDPAAAREYVIRAARLRPLLTDALPVVSVQALLELARVHMALDDPGGARAVLRQVSDILQRRPDLGVLPGEADELRAKVELIGRQGVGGSSLTTAELRVLPLLATHLSFREIAERLYLTPYTVKSQALSVYRKFGVSSRSAAIDRAHQVGVLGHGSSSVAPRTRGQGRPRR